VGGVEQRLGVFVVIPKTMPEESAGVGGEWSDDVGTRGYLVNCEVSVIVGGIDEI
jgi:hypothetical protein